MSTGNGSSALLNPRTARQALQAAQGKEKVDLLLSAPDPEALVQAIPEHDLYLAVLDVGPDDAAEVVALASPQQFRHFVDLAAWPRGDEGPDPRAVLRWLHLARDGGGQSDRARRRYLDKLALLDAEMRSLVLRKALRVHDLQEETEPAIADFGRTFRTPEGRYIVEFLPGAGEYGTLKELLEDLYGEDVLGTSRLLESLRWEVPTELEETARRWRDGRLRDLGFPDLDEALAFYARPARTAPAHEPSAASSAGAKTTALAAVPPSSPGLLESALALLAKDAIARTKASSTRSTPRWWRTRSRSTTWTKCAPRWPMPVPRSRSAWRFSRTAMPPPRRACWPGSPCGRSSRRDSEMPIGCKPERVGSRSPRVCPRRRR